MFPWDPLSDIYDVCNWLERKAWKTNPLQTKAKHSKRQQTFFFSRSHHLLFFPVQVVVTPVVCSCTTTSCRAFFWVAITLPRRGYCQHPTPHTSTTKCWPSSLDWKVVLSMRILWPSLLISLLLLLVFKNQLFEPVCPIIVWPQTYLDLTG